MDGWMDHWLLVSLVNNPTLSEGVILKCSNSIDLTQIWAGSPHFPIQLKLSHNT